MLSENGALFGLVVKRAPELQIVFVDFNAGPMRLPIVLDIFNLGHPCYFRLAVELGDKAIEFLHRSGGT